MTEKLKETIELLELDPDWAEENSELICDIEGLSPMQFADLVSAAVISLDEKLRILNLFRDTAELSDKEEDFLNEMDEFNDVCLWLEKIISKFNSPLSGTTTVVSLMGFNGFLFDDVTCIKGPSR